MIAKEDVESIFEALFDQLVVSFAPDKIVAEEYEVIVENYKCVYKEFSDKKRLDNIMREDVQDGAISSNICAKFPSESRKHFRAAETWYKSVASRV